MPSPAKSVRGGGNNSLCAGAYPAPNTTAKVPTDRALRARLRTAQGTDSSECMGYVIRLLNWRSKVLAGNHTDSAQQFREQSPKIGREEIPNLARTGKVNLKLAALDRLLACCRSRRKRRGHGREQRSAAIACQRPSRGTGQGRLVSIHKHARARIFPSKPKRSQASFWGLGKFSVDFVGPHVWMLRVGLVLPKQHRPFCGGSLDSPRVLRFRTRSRRRLRIPHMASESSFGSA